jgi:hypothetical protein
MTADASQKYEIFERKTAKHIKSFFNPLIFSQNHKFIVTIEFKLKLKSLQVSRITQHGRKTPCPQIYTGHVARVSRRTQETYH